MQISANTWVLAIALILSAFLIGGRYSIAGVGAGTNGVSFTIMIDRFTGAAWWCVPSACKPVPHQSN